MQRTRPARTRWTNRQRWNLAGLVAALSAYIGISASAPHSSATTTTYHFSVALVVVLTLTIIGLLFFSWIMGFYAWLELDRHAQRLTDAANRKAFGRMARGIWWLAVGLIVSSLIGAVQPFYQANVGLLAVMTQINYYVIILFPLLGFWWLRLGSRQLAVEAAAAMTTRNKLVTVGPPLVVLASFYIFLAFTNSPADTAALTAGATGFLVLPLNIVVVVGSWALGLLAALNVERATYRGEGARHARPLVKLYNGVLTTTGGFIILDALLSLGNTRLLVLPVAWLVFLIYGFISVVALGFLLVARAGRALLATPEPTGKGNN